MVWHEHKHERMQGMSKAQFASPPRRAPKGMSYGALEILYTIKLHGVQ